ncbi:hypothetical protein LZD49_12430 [Dyadobacter sp. CY261]|uniref:hypothetical protein n=1 Tax=Dyadobacter sp. CY261 TaxID=2907203 RepID=UPI001F1F3446|nr:hypothetical protein [Dyadobacter sp. CY261]MCF0071279.1 hypothetical protein [Dyadobacter sp. CY261]
MAIVVTAPEEIGYSKDGILWRFVDDRAGITPGIASEAYFSISDAVPDGTQIIFRWGNNELRYTARETIGEYGNEIPTFPAYSPPAHEAYVKSLVPYFQQNLFLDRDFDIEAYEASLFGTTLWVVKFTAKNRGTVYNLVNTRFAGGGIAITVEGTDDSVVANNGTYVEVWMQTPDLSMFQKQYEGVHPFDKDSIAEFDVASVLHSNLSAEIPDMVVKIAERCNQSRRKYYLRYALYGGETPSIGPVQQTDDFVVLLGGFVQWKQGPQSLIGTFKISERESKILQLRTSMRVVRTDEPVFASWVNFGPAGRTIYALATLTFADGSSQTTNTGVITAVEKYEKLVFGIGYKQLGLWILEGQGRVVTEYTVQICDDLGVVSDGYRLVVDYRHLEYVRYFAHINSYGCIETLMTYGKESDSWKVFKETARKVLPYSFDSSEAQFVEWNTTYQDIREVATGWMRRKDLILWLDLFISALKYRVINGRSYAVQVNSDTIQKGQDGDNQHALVFEYQFARVFDSVNEELMEGEDVSDVIPPNVITPGSQNPGSGGGTSSPPPPSNMYVDPYPIPGSRNPISSDGMFRTLENYQLKLPIGDPGKFINGEHKLSNMREAVNSYEKDPTVPTYAKSLVGLSKIVNDLQALPPENGLNVPKLGGQMAAWYIQRMTHPSFDKVPPIVVEKGVAFEKYLDLSIYQTSFHPIDQLDVEIVFNTDKLNGVNITADGLVLSVKGTLSEILSAKENVLLIVRDQAKNQGVVALRLQVIEETEEPEEPDNRPTCPKGPFHWLGAPIQVFDNGHFRAPFDGEGVDPLDWVISSSQDAANFIRKGQEAPYQGLAFLDVTTDPLPAGGYWLGIRGVLCKSNWEWREIVFPENAVVHFTEGYPKFNNNGTVSEFLMMVEPSGRFLTELIKLPENTKLYSEEHDYVANTTEIQIWKSGTYQDSKYRINVGTASAEITVGTPPSAPKEVFQLISGYNGAVLADLLAGAYNGPVPASGFNGTFEATDTVTAGRAYRLRMEYKVAGVFTNVPNAGQSGVSSVPTTMISKQRLFTALGADSRVVSFQNKSLNRYGEFRVTFEMFQGDTSATPVTKTYQQTFNLHAFEILGQVTNLGPGNGRYAPLISKMLYDGQNVVNDNVWAAPFAGLPKKLEYSVDGGNTWFSDVSAQGDIWGGEGAYSNVWILNNNSIDNFPKGTTRQVIFRNPALPAVRSASFAVANSPGGTGTEPTPLGTYQSTAGGRKFTFTKSPNFQLSFNNDGTFSDVTPGLQSGTPNKIDGRTVFYMINYSYFVSNGDATSIYTDLKNVFLRDGLYTIRHFSCDASKIPNLDAFKAGITGYGTNAVNVYNAKLSEITVAIRTTSNPGIPAWLIPSRRLNFGQGAKNKSFRNDKVFAMGALNLGDAHSIYHAKGSHTRMIDDESIDQPYSYRTFKWDWDGLPLITNEQLYAKFRHFIDNYGLTKDTVITDEIPENTQGTDPTILSRMKHAYQGALDKLRETTPGLDKKDTNLYGSYGADSTPDRFTWGTKAQVAQSLNEKVHNDWDPATQAWGGINDYYNSGHIDVRNVQCGYYMYNGLPRMIPYELVYANERWKIGTKTFDGQDRESKWVVYSTILCQTLVRNGEGKQIGVEEARTGDIIPFSNGEILSVYNTPSAAVAGEFYELGFWSTLIGNGILIWGEDTFGLDTTKIRTYEATNQPMYWTRSGGSREDWVSGQNGAPVNDPSGIYDLLYATVIDHAHLGYEDARELLDHAETLYFASYTSSRKSFTPAPGSTGLHLNGFGALNMGSLSFVDARDQKAGLAIVGVGSAGKVAVYYNGYLSAQEFEDNVTITHQGASVNLGRVYGRQTKFIKFPTSLP